MSRNSTITINGEKYILSDNPKHKIVKRIKNEQKKLLSGFLNKYRDEVEEFMNSEKDVNIESVMTKILSDHPDEMIDFTDKEEDFTIISTISIATNKIWDQEEIDEMTESEIKNLYSKCAEAIGGSAKDFLENSQIISIQEVKPEIQK